MFCRLCWLVVGCQRWYTYTSHLDYPLIPRHTTKTVRVRVRVHVIITLIILLLYWLLFDFCDHRCYRLRGSRICINLCARNANSAPTNMGSTRYMNFRDLANEGGLSELLTQTAVSFCDWSEESPPLVPTTVSIRWCCPDVPEELPGVDEDAGSSSISKEASRCASILRSC